VAEKGVILLEIKRGREGAKRKDKVEANNGSKMLSDPTHN
jgi:hypothetical protein